MDIRQLNADFGIVGQLEFVPGNGGFPCAAIRNRGAEALISLYGAQMLSFRPNGEAHDLLFLSRKAEFIQGKPIRGGIPVCWPWFGKHPEDANLPNHGFARTQLWMVAGSEAVSESATRLVLQLYNTPASKALWPFRFELILEITVGKTLSLALTTRNTDKQPFTISQAFHSYFNIGNIERVRVLGLESCDYLDKLDSGKKKHQADPVSIKEEVDRVYIDMHRELIIEDEALQRRIRITGVNTHSAVVWNPWISKAAAIPDLEPGDYQRFVCVEPGNVATDAVEILPGSEFKLLTTFTIEQ